MAERGHQPAHAVQAEAHAEQLEREQVALGLGGVHLGPSSASSSAVSRASLSRSACTTWGGAFSTKPGLDSFRSRRSTSLLSRARWASSLRMAASTSTSALGRTSIAPLGIGTEAPAGAD